jgi:signal transduction histidine kinase
VKRRDAAVVLVAGALLLLGLMSVFAIELANTQAKSKNDVRARVHERGVLAAALIDSLFQTVGQQLPTDQHLYGARVVTARTMNANKQTNVYTVLLDGSGRVVVASTGFTAQARANLAMSAALALVRARHPYGLGNVLPYGKTGVINLAIKFPTSYGPRVLVTGFQPRLLSNFLGGELKRIPGVKGAHNYLIDGQGTVIGSTNPALPVGRRITTPAAVKALAKPSGDIQGHYYVHVPISNSTWGVFLSAPDGPLFANVSGLRKWLPWLIFVAFGLIAIVALMLGRRVIRAAADVHYANERLGVLNRELGDTNDALERRAAELARSNSELEQFASIASHDLQEPLRKVRTFTEQIATGEADNLSDKGKDYLQRANTAAERMQRLIEDLLKFSRVATHGRPFAPVELAPLVAEVVDDLDAQVHESGAQIHVGELPTINGDAPQLRQMMQNLLSNALKFRREGVPPEVFVEATVGGGIAQVTVRDNGIGFEPQYSRRIFRVFERLHGRNAYPGTGIGLALCRKIAERHGGTITADGVPGEGSTFTVTLPVDQPQEVLSHAEPDDVHSASRETYIAV